MSWEQPGVDHVIYQDGSLAFPLLWTIEWRVTEVSQAGKEIATFVLKNLAHAFLPPKRYHI
jgi:hypothetical protein